MNTFVRNQETTEEQPVTLTVSVKSTFYHPDPDNIEDPDIREAVGKIRDFLLEMYNSNGAMPVALLYVAAEQVHGYTSENKCGKAVRQRAGDTLKAIRGGQDFCSFEYLPLLFPELKKEEK